MNTSLSSLSSAFPLQRAIFQLSGPDSIRFLNGQITQDVRLATSSQAVYSAITTAKGKMEGDLYVREYQGNLIIDIPIELREALFARLDKYIIADDVDLSDETDNFVLYHQLSETSEGWACNRFGVDGSDTLILKTDKEVQQTPETASTIEHLRIQHGIPVWGRELDTNILPPEARIENRAISYNKGCYIGQEVISRIRSANKTNRTLERFELSQPGPTPFEFFFEGNSKPAGCITSLYQSEHKTIALGYLTRKHSDQRNFHASGTEITKISS